MRRIALQSAVGGMALSVIGMAAAAIGSVRVACQSDNALFALERNR